MRRLFLRLRPVSFVVSFNSSNLFHSRKAGGFDELKETTNGDSQIWKRVDPDDSWPPQAGFVCGRESSGLTQLDRPATVLVPDQLAAGGRNVLPE